jgi:hypothetical protein
MSLGKRAINHSLSFRVAGLTKKNYDPRNVCAFKLRDRRSTFHSERPHPLLEGGCRQWMLVTVVGRVFGFLSSVDFSILVSTNLLLLIPSSSRAMPSSACELGDVRLVVWLLRQGAFRMLSTQSNHHWSPLSKTNPPLVHHHHRHRTLPS